MFFLTAYIAMQQNESEAISLTPAPVSALQSL